MPRKVNKHFARIRSLVSFRFLSRRYYSFRVEKCDGDAGDRSTEKTLSMARNCIKALRFFVSIAPGCGNQLQALLDVGITLLDRIEKVRECEGLKAELIRKIAYVLSMIEDALRNPDVEEARDLGQDLMEIKQVLQEINQFIERRYKSKKHKIIRLMTCQSEHTHFTTLWAELDESLKRLTIKSLIQLRADTQSLKGMIQTSTEELKAAADNLHGGISRLEARAIPSGNFGSDRCSFYARPESTFNTKRLICQIVQEDGFRERPCLDRLATMHAEPRGQPSMGYLFHFSFPDTFTIRADSSHILGATSSPATTHTFEDATIGLILLSFYLACIIIFLVYRSPNGFVGRHVGGNCVWVS